MLISVAVSSAPAGIIILSVPSVLISSPPEASIVLTAAVPTGLPTAVAEFSSCGTGGMFCWSLLQANKNSVQITAMPAR